MRKRAEPSVRKEGLQKVTITLVKFHLLAQLKKAARTLTRGEGLGPERADRWTTDQKSQNSKQADCEEKKP